MLLYSRRLCERHLGGDQLRNAGRLLRTVDPADCDDLVTRQGRDEVQTACDNKVNFSLNFRYNIEYNYLKIAIARRNIETLLYYLLNTFVLYSDLGDRLCDHIRRANRPLRPIVCDNARRFVLLAGKIWIEGG